jgi:hypothetical protein
MRIETETFRKSVFCISCVCFDERVHALTSHFQIIDRFRQIADAQHHINWCSCMECKSVFSSRHSLHIHHPDCRDEDADDIANRDVNEEEARTLVIACGACHMRETVREARMFLNPNFHGVREIDPLIPSHLTAVIAKADAKDARSFICAYDECEYGRCVRTQNCDLDMLNLSSL